MILNEDGNELTGEAELHEEHLLLHRCDANVGIGDKMFVIPGHCCSTVNLYNNIYLHNGDSIEDRMIVTARGRSQ